MGTRDGRIHPSKELACVEALDTLEEEEEEMEMREGTESFPDWKLRPETGMGSEEVWTNPVSPSG